MSACPPVSTLLLALLKPQDPARRTALTAHLAACATCRDRFDQLRSLGYAAVTPAGGTERGAACPNDVRLDRLVEPRDARPDDEAVAAHVVGCEACIGALGAALHRARADRQGDADTRDSRHRHLGTIGIVLVGAAALLVFLLLR